MSKGKNSHPNIYIPKTDLQSYMSKMKQAQSNFQNSMSIGQKLQTNFQSCFPATKEFELKLENFMSKLKAKKLTQFPKLLIYRLETQFSSFC